MLVILVCLPYVVIWLDSSEVGGQSRGVRCRYSQGSGVGGYWVMQVREYEILQEGIIARRCVE